MFSLWCLARSGSTWTAAFAHRFYLVGCKNCAAVVPRSWTQRRQVVNVHAAPHQVWNLLIQRARMFDAPTLTRRKAAPGRASRSIREF
jgi:hypothetical protein